MARSGVSKGQLGKVSTEIGITGIEDVRANIAKLMDRVTGPRFKKEVCMPAAMIARDEIKDLAPVKTGKLRDAVFAAEGDPKKPNAIVGVSRKLAPHGILVEYGHGGPHPAPPHAFFRPGVTAARGAMAATLASGMKKLVGEPIPGLRGSQSSFPTGAEFL